MYSATNGGMPKSKILLIDDEPDIVETTTFMLRTHSYLVSAASDGLEGLGKAKGEHPDLILLDIMMPDMDGYEVCARLKADEETKHIPVVMLTAKAESEAVLKCHGLGANDYIIKPFSLPTLLGKLRDFLGK